MNVDVSAEISTKNRYFSTLPITITSIINQTYKPKELLIYDDSDKQIDLRENNLYSNIFKLLNINNIEWKIIFGEKKGQVLNHQKAINHSKYPLLWRIDDDDLVEPNWLEKMFNLINSDEKIGAVSGLVLHTNIPQYYSFESYNKINEIFQVPNAQWFYHQDSSVKEVEHLNNSFLFRKKSAIHGYRVDLSPVGYREETIFTHNIFIDGWKLLIDPTTIIWHLKENEGGIRSYNEKIFYQHDEQIFLRYLEEKEKYKDKKVIVLDNGMGDHVVFKMILPKIKQKYKNKKIVIAACFPEIFEDDPDIELISIAESFNLFGNLDEFNIYKYMFERNWNKSMKDAFIEMYEL